MKENISRLLRSELKNLRANLPAKFFLGALVLCGALFIGSCNESSVVGVDVQPKSDHLNISYSDTTTLLTYTLREDSVETNKTSLNLLGSMNDPVFGKTRASIFTQVLFPDNVGNVNFGANPVLDSVVLALPCNGSYYGVLGQQTVNVYELSQSIYADSTYFSNDSVTYNATPVGSQTVTPDVTDSISIGGNKYGPQIRVRLDSTFGVHLLSASSSDLVDNTSLLNFFKGIYITTDNQGQNPGDGSIVYLDLMQPNSGITVYYHNDTVPASFTFSINSGCARFDHFSHDYSGATDISAQLSDSTKGQTSVYVQPLAGLKTKIVFPYIKNWVDSGPIVVNKAHMILKVDPSTIATGYDVPSTLYLVGIDSIGQNTFLPDYFEGSSYYGGTYDAGSMTYQFNISRYLQAVLDGKTDNNGLYILVAGSAVNGNRAVLNGAENPTYRMKLQLTYTKLH